MKKYTTLSEELNQLSQERKEIIVARTSEIRLEEITLQHLGEKLGLSQSELAASFELSQREISDLESGQSLELNTLRNVVNALGGTMEIIIKLPNKEPIMMNLSDSEAWR
ncbi:helix-turn-helix domain-containing protein [Dolichospermum sp. ST_con]|jgi:plasmid maintenance system antidote protein VapI|nr:helix-turn-helix domain-containing protein [Dolichospermum sp. ST_con]MDD1421004.1 helix-turn-helix domain-containing protein [Dolichospermum sp. ST_sed1]MDD1423506.1 helix-turn-helix domain-containing protein [Dolichospermum sp. ST_sed9]MDD1434954.1 helix-turn-helix domain-containing protein [Dolichospermum sp. ST_sed10]MDD1438969.1 helix-turn-helix domain-containing protein [Dolichospermum sp. ST_sed3]MDD1445326.1 helix-turn-helix domain-containing protein [Dolichospermum sp. ST_sed8]MDD